jgi:hypothetical protein
MQTLEQLQARRQAYLDAEAKILGTGQEYQISSGADGNMMKRASLKDIQEEIGNLDIQINLALNRIQRRSRVRPGVPLF